MEKHPAGNFCWVELGTTDQAGAKAFYGKLLGWQATDYPMGPGGSYTMFRLEGRDAGAAYTLRPEMRAQGVPPHWMPYVAVASADETTQKAGRLGGTVLAPAFDVMDAGRMAVLRDPTGAVFSIWQAKRMPGIGIAGVNTYCWADLSTPEPQRASEFYGELFGWQFMVSPQDPSGYLHIRNGEEWIGGVPPASSRPAGVPPHWMLWFEVADCDAAVATATAAGASVRMAPTTMERVGRIAVVADPQGAGFGMITSA